MTRWVRCGSSQKHKKMPGDATKWGEFDNQHAREISPKKKKNIQSETEINKKAKAVPSTSLFNKAEESLDEDFFEQDKYCLTENSDEINKQDSTFDESRSNISLSKNEELFTNKMHGSKKKKKRNNFDFEYSSFDGNNDEVHSNKVTVSHKKIKLENDCSIVTQNNKVLEQANSHSDFAENSKIPEESFSQKLDKKEKKKNKKEKRCNQVGSECFSENDGTMETYFQDSNESHSIKQEAEECATSSDKETEPVQSLQDINESAKKKYSNMNSDSNQSSKNNESFKNSLSKVLENKKEIRLKKLKKKREELGLIQLPHNVENKLRKIKKRLMEKGFPPEKLKEILRQERRKEELQYRKVYNPRKVIFKKFSLLIKFLKMCLVCCKIVFVSSLIVSFFLLHTFFKHCFSERT